MAGVTHAQDKRLRRILLKRAGLPTPPGITFSSRGSKSLQRFVSRHGYPLVLKTAIGENPSRKIDPITSWDELLAAVSQMRVLSDDQISPARSLVISGYAENMLNLDEDDEGNRIAPPRARLLVEKRVSGRYVRCLVCADVVVAAIEIDQSGREQFSKKLALHKDFEAVALRVASVIPGLSIASVDLVVKDPTQCLDGQTCYVVELTERPRLDSYMQASSALGPELADLLLCNQAKASLVELEDPSDEIMVHVRAEGLSEPEVVTPLLRQACDELELWNCVEALDCPEGIVEADLQGSPSAIAFLLEGLMSGVHFGQRATALDISQIPLRLGASGASRAL
jgi:hypothetical protein